MVDFKEILENKDPCISLPRNQARYAQSILSVFLGEFPTPVFHHSLYVGFGD